MYSWLIIIVLLLYAILQNPNIMEGFNPCFHSYYEPQTGHHRYPFKFYSLYGYYDCYPHWNFYKHRNLKNDWHFTKMRRRHGKKYIQMPSYNYVRQLY